MRRSRSLQYVLSLATSILAVAINYLIVLVLTHHITQNMGTEAYGFVSLAKTFASYAVVVTVALNAYAGRFISVSYHKENYESANRYFSSVFLADCIISALFCAVGIVAICFLQYILDIPEQLLHDVKLLFALDIFNFGVMTCTTVFSSSLLIANRFDLAGMIKCLAYGLEALLLICLYSMFAPKLYYVGIGLLISSVFIFVANIRLTKTFTPQLKVKRAAVSLQMIFEVVQKGIWSSFNQLGNLLNSGLDLYVTNLMISPFVTGQLAIVKTISTIATTLFQLVAQPMQPQLVKYYACNQTDRLIDAFKLSIKVNGMLSNVLFAGFVTWGSVYYELLTPSQDIQQLFMLTIVTISGSIIEGAVYPLYYAYTLTLKNRKPAIITVLSGLCNVVAMYVLIRFFGAGVYCVVGTTAVLSWIVNFGFTPIYAARCLQQSPTIFYPTLVKHALSCCVQTGVFYIIGKWIVPDTWVELIAVAIVCATIGALLHILIVCNRSDMRWILRLFRKKTAET